MRDFESLGLLEHNRWIMLQTDVVWLRLGNEHPLFGQRTSAKQRMSNEVSGALSDDQVRPKEEAILF